MKRPYSDRTDVEESVQAFLGKEVEHTPAFGLTTLFLVGRLPVGEVSDLIETAQNRQRAEGLQPLRHLFFGANWSFDGDEVQKWSDTIRHFLKEGFWCTLDFRPQQVPLVQKSGLCRHVRFIPLIGVRVPWALGLGNNATLKIDDVAFAGTNPGVWCMPLHELLHDKTKLTTWDVYSTDLVLKTN